MSWNVSGTRATTSWQGLHPGTLIILILMRIENDADAAGTPDLIYQLRRSHRALTWVRAVWHWNGEESWKVRLLCSHFKGNSTHVYYFRGIMKRESRSYWEREGWHTAPLSLHNSHLKSTSYCYFQIKNIFNVSGLPFLLTVKLISLGPFQIFIRTWISVSTLSTPARCINHIYRASEVM